MTTYGGSAVAGLTTTVCAISAATAYADSGATTRTGSGAAACGNSGGTACAACGDGVAIGVLVVRGEDTGDCLLKMSMVDWNASEVPTRLVAESCECADWTEGERTRSNEKLPCTGVTGVPLADADAERGDGDAI